MKGITYRVLTDMYTTNNNNKDCNWSHTVTVSLWLEKLITYKVLTVMYDNNNNKDRSWSDTVTVS